MTVPSITTAPAPARAVEAVRPTDSLTGPGLQPPASGTARTVATAFAVETLGKSSMSVRERFSTLQQRFLPDKAKGVDVRFQFLLSGKGGGEWYVEIKNGKVTVKEGKGPNPTATLRASAADYLKIANGEMNKMWAFVRGRLKVDGDKDALGKFDEYFKKP
jgi:putative sterol carrier protein